MRITIPDPCLVILCGVAGCGKSTFAGRHFRRCQVVSSDRCREMVSDSAAAMWASADAFELFHLIISKRLRHRRLTVADSTALGKSARSQLRRIAREAGVPAVLLLFNVPRKTCLARDAGRRRKVGTVPIDAQFEKLAAALGDVRRERYDAVYILDEKEMDSAGIRRGREGRGRSAFEG